MAAALSLQYPLVIQEAAKLRKKGVGVHIACIEVLGGAEKRFTLPLCIVVKGRHV